MNALAALVLLLPPIHVAPPVRPLPAVHRVVHHPTRLLAPSRPVLPDRGGPDAVYQRRLILQLCAARPVFCDWVVR